MKLPESGRNGHSSSGGRNELTAAPAAAPHVVRIADPKSQMQALSYHAPSENLTVIFRNSPKPYIHTHVPAEVFNAFRAWHAAGYSPGKFYHTHIKHYPLQQG